MFQLFAGRTTPDTSIFSYSQESGDWSEYNNLTYVPKFLDELVNVAESEDSAFLAEAYDTCGMDNNECLFDTLATNSTELGANTMAVDAMFQELVENLGKSNLLVLCVFNWLLQVRHTCVLMGPGSNKMFKLTLGILSYHGVLLMIYGN